MAYLLILDFFLNGFFVAFFVFLNAEIKKKKVLWTMNHFAQLQAYW